MGADDPGLRRWRRWGEEVGNEVVGAHAEGGRECPDRSVRLDMVRILVRGRWMCPIGIRGPVGIP
jgi:hypothetical protein